jgi:hypothetical protein
MNMARALASEIVGKTRYKSVEHVERIVRSCMNGQPIGGVVGGAGHGISSGGLR